MSALTFVVTATTEYDNGDTPTAHEPHYFPTHERAVSHAKHVTGNAANNNGTFSGEWQRNYVLSFIDEAFASDLPTKLKVTARITTAYTIPSQQETT